MGLFEKMIENKEKHMLDRVPDNKYENDAPFELVKKTKHKLVKNLFSHKND